MGPPSEKSGWKLFTSLAVPPSTLLLFQLLAWSTAPAAPRKAFVPLGVARFTTAPRPIGADASIAPVLICVSPRASELMLMNPL